MAGLREQRKDRTRREIVAATADLTRESGTADFTMPQVAERSGVALRTLYRYFPTRQALVDALATVADQVRRVDVPVPRTPDEIEGWLVGAWTNLLADEALLRPQHVWPSGTAVRRSRVAAHRALTEAIISGIRPDLDAAAVDDLVDLALVLTSSTALFEYVDVLDVEVERAARLSATALRVAIETA